MTALNFRLRTKVSMHNASILFFCSHPAKQGANRKPLSILKSCSHHKIKNIGGAHESRLGEALPFRSIADRADGRASPEGSPASSPTSSVKRAAEARAHSSWWFS